MNVYDLFIFIPIALGLIFGIFKGFVKEVVSLLAVVAAILFAEFFSAQFAPILGKWFHLSEKIAITFSYTLVFILTIFGALLLSRMTDKVLRSVSLGWLNSMLGGLFGALKFAIVVSVMMNLFNALDSKFHFANPQKKEDSIGYFAVLKLAPGLWKESKETYEENRDKFPKKETFDTSHKQL